jgi:hypothetical protein
MKIRFVVLAAAVLVGLAACGATSATSSLTPEADALTSVGFTSADLAPAADPSPSTSGAAGHRAGKLRRELGRHVEHGEVVVRTKDGDKTVDVQRGTVTAVTGSSVTVKSTDGFTETWAFGSPLRVVENRTTVQTSEVKTGVEVGVAGVKNGSTVTANLIVIAKKS